WMPAIGAGKQLIGLVLSADQQLSAVLADLDHEGLPRGDSSTGLQSKLNTRVFSPGGAENYSRSQPRNLVSRRPAAQLGLEAVHGMPQRWPGGFRAGEVGFLAERLQPECEIGHRLRSKRAGRSFQRVRGDMQLLRILGLQGLLDRSHLSRDFL